MGGGGRDTGGDEDHGLFVPVRVASREDLQSRHVSDAAWHSQRYILLHVSHFKAERLLACEETKG